MRFRAPRSNPPHDLVRHPEGGDRWRWVGRDEPYFTGAPEDSQDALGVPFAEALGITRDRIAVVPVDQDDTSAPAGPDRSLVRRVLALSLREDDVVVLETDAAGEPAFSDRTWSEALGVKVRVVTVAGMRVADVVHSPGRAADDRRPQASDAEQFAAGVLVGNLIRHQKQLEEREQMVWGAPVAWLTRDQIGLVIRAQPDMVTTSEIDMGIEWQVAGVPVGMVEHESVSTPVVEGWEGWRVSEPRDAWVCAPLRAEPAPEGVQEGDSAPAARGDAGADMVRLTEASAYGRLVAVSPRMTGEAVARLVDEGFRRWRAELDADGWPHEEPVGTLTGEQALLLLEHVPQSLTGTVEPGRFGMTGVRVHGIRIRMVEHQQVLARVFGHELPDTGWLDRLNSHGPDGPSRHEHHMAGALTGAFRAWRAEVDEARAQGRGPSDEPVGLLMPEHLGLVLRCCPWLLTQRRGVWAIHGIAVQLVREQEQSTPVTRGWAGFAEPGTPERPEGGR